MLESGCLLLQSITATARRNKPEAEGFSAEEFWLPFDVTKKIRAALVRYNSLLSSSETPFPVGLTCVTCAHQT
jgi:hypothetical protein